jgi:hypothetical protein
MQMIKSALEPAENWTLGPKMERIFSARWFFLVLVLLGFGLTLKSWGSLDPPTLISDESVYLLQAQIFASGHLAGEGRPLPEFFEQIHILSAPRLAPKYLPGHALLLVPGVWLGWPTIMPCLLVSLTGGLLFVFVLRAVNSSVAWLTWCLC